MHNSPSQPLDAVTGAWSYTGHYIARALLARGRRVCTLTTRRPPSPDPFRGAVASHPLDWSSPPELAQSLRGVHTLYNTYWVRHDRAPRRNLVWPTHEEAVRNSFRLLDAALMAGVQRVVHVSITNPTVDTSLTYFRGKARIEAYLQRSGLSYAIVRPSLLFGGGDILINNVAWAVRRLPFFLVPGPLAYHVRPIHVADMARICCDFGTGTENVTRDACGPEQYRFENMVRMIGRETIGRTPLIVALPIRVCHALYSGAGMFLKDQVLSLAELQGLAADHLRSDEEPLGSIRLSAWVRENRAQLGKDFHPEPARQVLPAS